MENESPVNSVKKSQNELQYQESEEKLTEHVVILEQNANVQIADKREPKLKENTCPCVICNPKMIPNYSSDTNSSIKIPSIEIRPKKRLRIPSYSDE